MTWADESTGVAPTGRLLTRDEFLAVLADLRAWVEHDSSAEGSLAYEWGEEPGHYRVQASLRFGNDMGQGGVRLLREDVPA